MGYEKKKKGEKKNVTSASVKTEKRNWKAFDEMYEISNTISQLKWGLFNNKKLYQIIVLRVADWAQWFSGSVSKRHGEWINKIYVFALIFDCSYVRTPPVVSSYFCARQTDRPTVRSNRRKYSCICVCNMKQKIQNDFEMSKFDESAPKRLSTMWFNAVARWAPSHETCKAKIFDSNEIVANVKMFILMAHSKTKSKTMV